MRLDQALKICRFVRRVGWANCRYCLTIDDGGVINSTGENDLYSNHILGLRGLIADDWVALKPCTPKEIYRVDNVRFEVISTPLEEDKGN